MAPYAQTYTFSNGTTADGGQVQTEITALGTSVNNITNAQIDPTAGIAISKTVLGTYTAPTTMAFSILTGSGGNPSQGNGTWAAYYTQIGKVVTFVIGWTFGSTSNAGTGNYTITLPIAAAYPTSFSVLFKDASTGFYWSRTTGLDAGSGAFVIPVGDSGATLAGAAQPMTWATNDIMYVGGSYIVA